MNWGELLARARAAQKNAYAPYSKFLVGAAIETEDGSIFAGCNVENRSYGATLCAERVAMTSAVVAEQRRAVAVAVVTDTDPPSPPCGLCLQTLAEFGDPDLPVLLANGSRQFECRLGDLLPRPFELPGDWSAGQPGR